MESESPVRKRQQCKACDTCRRRKVKCDVQSSEDNSSCSGCRKAGTECLTTIGWNKPRRQRKKTGRALQQDQHVQLNNRISEPTSNNDNHGFARVTSPTSPAQDGVSSLLAAAQTSPHQTETPTTAHADATSKASDAISQRNQFARSGLARFFKHGIDAGVWVCFDSPENARIAYVGTSVSNLYHLVELHQSSQPRPLSSEAGTESILLNPHTGGSGPVAGPAPSGSHLARENRKILHYPYPPIRPPKPWKPVSDMWCSSSAHDLATDVSSFPAPEVRDALVSAYFEHIHPFFPIISMPEFLAMYNTPDKPPPLLLFQAVLMAGAHACDHPLVAEDRHTVKSILFRRASLLYHTRHESDRIHLMQAAALFTWHVGDGDTVTGGPWYWSGVAILVGCGLGAHRHSELLPALERSQYRRCWWAAFVSEVMSSLENGRPCAIRAEDIDQLPLIEEDMTDTPGLPNNSPTSSPQTGGRGVGLEITPHPSSQSPQFLNSMVELAYIGLEIMAANAPAQDRIADIDGINARLGRWSLRSGVSSATKEETQMTFHLRIHYHLMLLHLYRNFDSPDSHTIRSTAAQSIITSLERLSALHSLCQCQFTGVSAVIAAGIQLANELRAAADACNLLLVIHTLDLLSRLLQCATLLAKYWPNAEAAHSVFQELHQKYETYVEQGMQGEEGVTVDENILDWNRLLSGAQTTTQTNNFAVDQDWLNMSTWPNFL